MPTGISKTPEKTRLKLSLAFRGEKSHFWKGGITNEYRNIRNSLEHELWRESVFKRDDRTCVQCGFKSKKVKPADIHADHIKSFADYPELRLAIDNGRTLCVSCHRKTDTWGWWNHKRPGIKWNNLVNKGSFKKGHLAYKYYLGKKLSPEHVQKVSEGNKRYWANKKLQVHATI